MIFKMDTETARLHEEAYEEWQKNHKAKGAGPSPFAESAGDIVTLGFILIGFALWLLGIAVGFMFNPWFGLACIIPIVGVPVGVAGAFIFVLAVL
jgi:hypothetical protein